MQGTRGPHGGFDGGGGKGCGLSPIEDVAEVWLIRTWHLRSLGNMFSTHLATRAYIWFSSHSAGKCVKNVVICACTHTALYSTA